MRLEDWEQERINEARTAMLRGVMTNEAFEKRVLRIQTDGEYSKMLRDDPRRFNTNLAAATGGNPEHHDGF